MFQEFPKCLTKGEAYMIVLDKDEEAKARVDGFRFFDDTEPAAEPKKRPGRPPKVKE